jgi:hypothetical protein
LLLLLLWELTLYKTPHKHYGCRSRSAPGAGID